MPRPRDRPLRPAAPLRTGSVRIVFNLLPTLKPKTGVGHYAARLFAALREQLPADSLHGFPTSPLADIVRRVQRARAGGPPQVGQLPSAVGRLSSAAKNVLRAAGR